MLQSLVHVTSHSMKLGHNFTCSCKGENGYPPADVNWHDNKGNPIGAPGKEHKILVFRNFTEEYGGTYTCKVRSYTLMEEKSIAIIVPVFNCKHDLFNS